jgi:antitoxin ChpS
MSKIVEHRAPGGGDQVMEIVLRKYGNSTVLALPQAVLKDLGLAAGQLMTLRVGANGSITLAPKRKYTLKQLLAQCDLKAAPPRDMALLDHARPVGQEVW